MEKNIARGFATEVPSAGTSTKARQYGAAAELISLAEEIAWIAEDMLRPWCKQDAILGHVASWGDRFPMAEHVGQVDECVKAAARRQYRLPLSCLRQSELSNCKSWAMTAEWSGFPLSVKNDPKSCEGPRGG
jgi:hypothetical protein